MVYMEPDFLERVKEEFELQGCNINEYSPLVLAYIGDAVYEMIIRLKLVLEANEQVEKLHKKATAYVKAKAQKDLMEIILPMLTEDELLVYKRARNAKQHTIPKNATMSDYHKATGFEALMGYLYLQKKNERIFELIMKGINEL